MPPQQDTHAARRQHERRAADTCISQIGDQVYPVENWSQGGVLLNGANRFLNRNDVHEVTMRFRLRDRVLNVKQPARVVRVAGNRAALQFLPLTREIRNAFQTVIDDLVASGFANSQA